MFWINVRRILKSGAFNFWRSGFVSLASVLVMVVTLSVIGSIIFLGAILNSTLEELRDKVDVNVYFLTTAPEDSILSLKKSLESLPEVDSVGYVTREQALEEFVKRHEKDQTTLQALEELGENPLGASINIKAKNPSQYEGIADFLQQGSFVSEDGEPIIDNINYFQNKIAIDKLSRIIDSSERLGLILMIVLIIISILITLNTIRLTIYISREEISVMRLVGASMNYIRGPFMVGGIIYGLISSIITILLFIPVTYWLGGITENFFIGLNVFDYYKAHFIQIPLILITSGVAIGAISSLLAVRRYLKV